MENQQHLKTFCAILSPWTPGGSKPAAWEDPSIDWVQIAAIANRNMLAPAFYQACRNKQILSVLPEQFQAYLAEIYRLNLQRNEALKQQLTDLVALLGDRGIRPLLMKGAATLVNDLFAAPGSRFMSDLDLLIAENKLAEAVAILQEDGYAILEDIAHLPYAELDFTDKHHFAPMGKPGEPASVELHRRMLGRKGELLPNSLVWEKCREIPVGKGMAAVLPPEEEILCCFAHTQFGDAKHRDRLLDLRQLHHFAQLCYRHQARIDWARVEDRLQTCAVLPEFKAYLLLAREYFAVETPLTDPEDRYARRHLRGVMAQTRRLPRLLNLTRLVWNDLARAFTKENLIINYGYRDESTARLRLRHFRFLAGRYLQKQVWREKFFKRRPF